MKRLMFASAVAVALCGMAQAEARQPSLMRALGGKLVQDVPADPSDLESYTHDLARNSEDYGAIAETLANAEDIDMTYKLQLKLNVVENSGKAPKASDFIEAVPAGVSYFGSTKKTIKGAVWAKPRPSVIAEAVLKSGLVDEIGTNTWAFGGVESTILNLAGALTEVRSVALWDTKARAYLSPTLFVMGGVGMGKDGKEAWGGFLAVLGAKVGKLADQAQTVLSMNESGYAVLDGGLLMTNAIQFLDADVGLVFGVGIGKNNLSKSGRYIKSLSGNCSYLSTATAPLFDGNGVLTTKDLGKRFTAGPFGVFYNVYTGKPYPVPVDVSLGFGTWTLQANSASIKKFAKCAGDQAKKAEVFLAKSSLPRYAGKEECVPDMYRVVLDAALLGDSAAGAKAYLEGRKAELATLPVKMAAAGRPVTEKIQADAMATAGLIDALIKLCDDAASLGVADTSNMPLDLDL